MIWNCLKSKTTERAAAAAKGVDRNGTIFSSEFIRMAGVLLACEVLPLVSVA